MALLSFLLIVLNATFFADNKMAAKDLPKASVVNLLGDETSKWVQLSFGKCHYKMSGQGLQSNLKPKI